MRTWKKKPKNLSFSKAGGVDFLPSIFILDINTPFNRHYHQIKRHVPSIGYTDCLHQTGRRVYEGVSNPFQGAGRHLKPQKIEMPIYSPTSMLRPP